MKNFPKLMIVDGEVILATDQKDLDDYVWEVEQNQASDGDFDEEEEEWAEFVARNSNVHVEEYDSTNEDHLMLPGSEDLRPGIQEYQKKIERQKRIKQLEAKIKFQMHRNELDAASLQKGIDKATSMVSELEALLNE